MEALYSRKNQQITKLIESNEGFEFCDIWRIQSPSSQSYKFRQKHFSGLIRRRIDYIFLLNSLQEFVSKIDILPVLSTDHSPLTLTVSKPQNFT